MWFCTVGKTPTRKRYEGNNMRELTAVPAEIQMSPASITEWWDADNWAVTPLAIDYVYIAPDGQLTDRSADGLYIGHAVAEDIGHCVPTRVGRLVIWHADNFLRNGAPVNPVADRIARRLGYRAEPGYWRGPIALSMADDEHGLNMPMSMAVLETLDELARDPA